MYQEGYWLLRLFRHLPTIRNIQAVSRLHSYIVIFHINKAGILHKVYPEEQKIVATLFQL